MENINKLYACNNLSLPKLITNSYSVSPDGGATFLSIPNRIARCSRVKHSQNVLIKPAIKRKYGYSY